MTDLTGKVALITGSAKGLGRAIARRYAKLGARVVINDLEAADALVEEIRGGGGEAIAITADISTVAGVEALFADALAAFGKIDIVVANAGVELVGIPVTDYSEKQFDRVYAINTKGAFFTLQQAARHVEDHGRIIYIASSTTAFPARGFAVYSSSKLAPRMIVEILAREIAHRGVTVNSIMPFATDGAGIFTDDDQAYRDIRGRAAQACPMGRMGTLDDVANVAEFFAGELSSFVSGQHLLVNGAASA